MDIAINNNFAGAALPLRRQLEMMAEAGFTHLHWDHQFNSDVMFSIYEMREYRKWLKELGLTLLDVHAAAGREKLWYALEEYRRKSGVELVINRIELFSELEGTGALAIHIPCYRRAVGFPQEELDRIPQYVVQLRKTLDELMPVLEKHHACLALENMPNEEFEVSEELLRDYPADRLGLAYDSGHGNYGFNRGLDHLERLKQRLAVVHLHDNDGTLDKHQPPFYGNVDWRRLVDIIATSAYHGPLSFELSMKHTPFFDPELPERNQAEPTIRQFLADAFQRCSKVAKMYRRQP